MRRVTMVETYLNEIISYGGEPDTRAEAILDMQRMGIPQSGIDRWFQGYELGQRIRARQQDSLLENSLDPARVKLIEPK